MSTDNPESPETKKSLVLLVDDDEVFCDVLGRALIRRGYEVMTAYSVNEAEQLLKSNVPDYAIVDLRMPGASGLELVEHMGKIIPSIKTVVLTSYASIATAVEAIKLGAVHYLTKPADADEIVAALNRDNVGNSQTPVPQRTLSVERLEWEHLQKVLASCDGNISEAARQLGMHRRTLQRKLQKKPVRE